MTTRVLIVGGGVAALETCLALDALAGDRVELSVIAPRRWFQHRPVAVRDPLAIESRRRIALTRLLHGTSARVRRDRVVMVDPARRRVHTAAGHERSYDVLVLAVGAAPRSVPAAAEPLDEDHVAACRGLFRADRTDSLAFVEPAAPVRGFDLYDLAIDTAVRLRRQHVDPQLALVTAQPAPMAILGVRAAEAVAATLGAHGVRVIPSAHVRAIGDGRLELVPGPKTVQAAHVIVAPRLGGLRLRELPCDRDGFIPVDLHGRVRDLDGVFAAGDCTSFPVKHPSIAAQQADAVASAIAADVGAALHPDPFDPVLRCMLPSRLRWYVEAPLAGGRGDATRISALPLWPRDVRFGARFLAPRLAGETVHPPGQRGRRAGNERSPDVVVLARSNE